MLKGRSKKFAPKAAVRRPTVTPASTQSSARPSVEPQSSGGPQWQAAALEKDSQDVLSSVSPVAQVLSTVESTPQRGLGQPTIEKDNSATEDSSRQPPSPQSKRKSREEITEEPPAKRVALADKQATTAQNSRAWNENQESTENETPRRPTKQPTPPPPEPTEARSQSSPPPIRHDIEQLRTPLSSERATPQQHVRFSQSNANDDGSEHAPPSSPRISSPPRDEYPPPPYAEETSRLATPEPGHRAAGGGLGLPDAGLSDLGAAGSSEVLIDPDNLSGGSNRVHLATLDSLDDGNIDVPESAASSSQARDRKKRAYDAKKGKEEAVSTTTLARGKPKPKRTRRPVASKKDKVAKKPNKKREETPDNASDLEIDVYGKTMADLCVDQKRGRKSINLATVRQNMSKQKEDRRKQLQMYHDMIEEGEEPLAKKKEEQAGPPVEIQTQGAQMRVVNGAIVLDNESMQVNHHRNNGDDIQEIVEENDFTHLITSNSFKKDPKILRDFRKTQTWDEAATEMFYQGLRTWGTDFETIATMFPHRNRRSIKLKFNREEKMNSTKVTRALLGPRVLVDLEEQLDELQTLGKIRLDEIDDIEAVQIADKLEFDEKQARRAKELEDERLRKIEEINKNKEAGRRVLDSDEESEPDEGRRGKGKKKQKSGPKKKKNRHSTAPEETMEVLHSIEND